MQHEKANDVTGQTQRENIFMILVGVVAITLPFKAIYNSVACGLLFLFWLMVMRKDFSKPRLFYVLLQSLPFWLALVGLLYSSDTGEGWFRTQQKSLLLLLPLVVGTARIEPEKMQRWSLSLFIVATFLACSFCLFDAVRWWWVTDSTELFFAHGLVEQIDLYTYIMALLCLASGVVLASAQLGYLNLHVRLMSRTVCIILCVFFSLFIFLLSVKQIIIIWLLVAVLGSGLVISRKFRWIMIVIAFATSGFATYFVPTLREKVTEVLSREHVPLDQDASLGRNWNGVALREAIWRCAWDAIRQEFWFGYGTGDSQAALQNAYEKRMFYFASRYNTFNTHNQYLQTWVGHGALGLTVWLVGLGWLCYANRANRVLAVMLGCLALSMVTESMLETNKGNLVMAFLVPFLLLSGSQTSTGDNRLQTAL